ncbi:MAG: type II secretion system major pseudopilin GspG [Candidatus Omnitrophica bacterium]|nr:type II secretion system major pseudopilin GspG [Candidatus Omnitrophota bacterium]
MRRAFTLIELMLVVIIISVLAAMVVPNLVGRSQEARVAAASGGIENLSVALGLYELDNGMFPSSEQGLRALKVKPSSSPTPPNWKRPYIKKIPKDPWGNPYTYASPGVHNTQDYDLSSFGPDGIESDDDITNWETEEE